MKDDDATDGGRGNFADTLAALKRDGGNVLVTGELPGDVHTRAGRALLGGTDGPPRRRIVVTVGRSHVLDDRLPEGAPRDDDHLLVVDSGHVTRGGAAAIDGGHGPTDPGGPDDAPTVRRTSGQDLQVLGESIETAIDDLSAAAGGFAPSELRVCVDDLASLFAEHDRGDVLAFCHVIANRVAAENGMGHFHVAFPPDDDLVSALEPLFDVVVELDTIDGTPHQRWRTGDGESGWIPL